MKRSFLSFLLSFALVASLGSSAVLARQSAVKSQTLSTPNDFTIREQTTEEVPSYVDGEVIVTLKDTEDSEPTTSGICPADVEIEHTWDFGEISISEVSSQELSTEQLIDDLSREENVVSVEPNYYRQKLSTNDNYRPYQWYLNGDGPFHPGSPGIQEQKIPSSAKSSSPIVAIVDTGIDYTHEDLKDHMWINPYPALAGVYGYDFGDYDYDPMDEDEDGHGTHCAGIISAVRNNTTGIAGISDARLMALKIFDRNGSGTDANIIAAFNYIYQAQNLGANIAAVNCSWGGGGATPAYEKLLVEKLGSNGSLFIFAAGNSDNNHDLFGGNYSCPYDMNNDYVIKVGASDLNDRRAYYSDYGKTTVDLFAPGVNIVSTVNYDSFVPFMYSDEQREALCSFYSSFDTNDTILYSPNELERSSGNISYGEKTYSDNDFLGADDSGSLSVFLDTDQPKSDCELYLDVTDLHLDREKSYFVSYELGMEENGSISWNHNFILRTHRNFLDFEGRTYLRIVGLSGDFRGVSKIYIDNPAISVAVDNSTTFGKYNLLSGTSMAAPFVTAAVALLSAMYPKDTAAQRRSRLLHCTRPSAYLSSYCSTGGVLDLSKLSTATYDDSLKPKQTPKPGTNKKVAVKKVKLNKKKATLRYGKKLKLKATVTPKNATNKKVKWSVSKKKYATVTKKGVVKAKKPGIGHSVKVYAKAKDGSGKKAVCKVKIKKRR